MKTQFDTAELRAQARDMSIAEIADEHGVSYSAARHALRRRNLKAQVTGKTFRSEVARMKAPEAVEYLLDCLDTLTQVETVDIAPWSLTRTERRLFSCLADHAGVPVTTESLYNAMYFDRYAADELPNINLVAVYVCKLRQKIPDDAGQIENVRSLGFVWRPAK